MENERNGAQAAAGAAARVWCRTVAVLLLAGVAMAAPARAESAGSEDSIFVPMADPQSSVRWGFGARLQFDVADYRDDGGTSLGSGSDVRRARLTVDAEIGRDWAAKATYDFAREGREGIRDTYLQYRGFDAGRITAGHFKEPFGLERKTSVRDLPFLERSLVSALAPSRHLGVEYQHTGSNWTAAAGVFGKGAEDGGTNTGEGVSGRVTFAPSQQAGAVRHIGTGVAHRWTGSSKELRYSSRPESRTTSTRLVDTGTFLANSFTAYGLELAASGGPLSIQAEYMLAQVERDNAESLYFPGWYVQASWFLTGERQPYDREKATFSRVEPLRSVANGGFGAWQLAARLSDLDLNDSEIDGGHERNLTLSMAWHLTSVFRLMVEHIRVLKLEGGPYPGAQPEILQARFQIAY